MTGLGQRLAVGSGMILRQGPAAMWAGEWRETLARWFVVALAAALGATALSLHPWLWAAAAAVWVAVALAMTGVPNDEDEETDEPDDALPLVDEDYLLDILWDLLHDGRGVHLRAVAEELTADYAGRPWTIAEVRLLLDAAEIPTRHAVRMRHAPKGQEVAPGVYITDLPPRPSPAPSDPGVADVSGQVTGATATATPTVEETGEGAMLIIKTGADRTQTVPPARRRRGVNR